MAVTKDMLLSELQDLLRMTAFEQTIANVRRLQARTTPIEQELAANAEKSGERRALLSDAVRQVGGVPDVVGASLSKAGAFLQAQVNQVQTLQGALLGDLALEHALRERARYARTLAQTLGYSQVIPVLDRLEVAHSATIEWLETRLAEVAQTGTSALRATPAQVAVTTVRRFAGIPFGAFAGTVNRVSGLLTRTSSSVRDVASDAAGRVAETAGRAVDTAQSAAGTAADAAQSAAGTATDAAQSAPDVIDLTETDETAMPFPAYDKLSGDSIMRHVKDTDDIDELRGILAFEQAHKARKGVVQAVTERLDALTNA